MNAILKETWISVRALVVLVVLCCFLYPVTVYAIGQVAFPWQANGSLVDKDGKPTTPENAVGSRLLGQSFASPGYFHPRPSAAGSGYDAANSSGTNLGPLSDKLLNGVADDPKTKDVDESFAGVKQLVQAYRDENGLDASVLVPVDAVTRSASGRMRNREVPGDCHATSFAGGEGEGRTGEAGSSHRDQAELRRCALDWFLARSFRSVHKTVPSRSRL